MTAQVNAQMAAQGWPAALLDAISDTAPKPYDGPSEDLVTDEDEERALEASMRRMAETFTAKFAGALVGSLPLPGPAPAPTLPVLDAEVVESDSVAEDIRHLEARPTAKRQAKAAELRATRERGQHALDTSQSTAGPVDPAPEPEPVPRRSGRTTTTLGTSPGGIVNYGGPR